VLSVDLFDTIVFRDCLSPADILWRVVANQSAKEIGLDRSWVALRREVERRLTRASPDRETSLADIYAQLAHSGAISTEKAQETMQLEINEELKIWRPNLELLRILNNLQSRGIEIIVYSDTYFPYAEIRRWLDIYLPFATLFCSSATRRTKSSGRAFTFLRGLYPDKSLMHAGDNLYSDGVIPMRYNIDAVIIEGRGRFSSTLPPEISDLARLRGLERFPEILELRLQAGLDVVTAQWAYAWSLFFVCFLESLKKYTERQQIEQVCFTSRDCETLYKCLVESGRSSAFPNVQYLRTSRLSLGPLSSNDSAQIDQKMLIKRYLRREIAESGALSRIVSVELGYHGRVQRAIQQALGERASVYGYYVSLVPRSAVELYPRTASFLWNTGTYNLSILEAMCGFLEDSCAGYALDQTGNVCPVFRDSRGDKSDETYTLILRECLTHLLINNWNADDFGNRSALTKACYKMVRRLHMFPRRLEVVRLRRWRNFGAAHGHGMIGEEASWKSVLMMRVDEDNIWPAGTLAFRIRNRYLAYALQHVNSTGRSALAWVERRRAGPKAARAKSGGEIK
jgi:FMN phosphatase YigB (HAD superfamily)